MKCVICNANKVVIKKEGKFSFVQCTHCRVVYHTPLPDSAFLVRWYSKEMFSKRWKGNLHNAIKVNNDRNKDTFKIYFNSIKKEVGSVCNKRVLDIGCYDGSFLVYFKEEGANCIGIDLNSGLVDLGKHRHGLDLRTGNLESFNFTKESFDIITFNQVLEHLNNPIEFITKVKALLNPHGIIEFSVPDFSVNKKIDFPNHLFHFVATSLNELVLRTGLTGIIYQEKPNRALVAICKKKI